MAIPFEIAYNSDLIIRDPSEAATLCVFYDQVFLPYTNRKSSRELIGKRGIRDEYTNDIADWEVKYGTLFDEGVLRRLPAIEGLTKFVKKERTRVFIEYPRGDVYDIWNLVHDGSELPEGIGTKHRDAQGGYYYQFDELKSNEVIIRAEERLVKSWSRFIGRKGARHRKCRLIESRWIEKCKEKHELDTAVDSKISDLLSVHIDKYESGNAPLIRLDLARHLLRTDITIPQIFALAQGRPSKDIFVALEATATFRYLLPKLHTYHPTQILELRDKIKDTREGFTLHLWKLSSGLKECAEHGVSVGEAARFAENIIRTDLIPDYREFQRQFESMRADKWGKVLDAAGRIAEIDAAPWTPKFWGMLLKAIGVTALGFKAAERELLSNRYQAFQFMNYVEKSAART